MSDSPDSSDAPLSNWDAMNWVERLNTSLQVLRSHVDQTTGEGTFSFRNVLMDAGLTKNQVSHVAQIFKKHQVATCLRRSHPSEWRIDLKHVYSAEGEQPEEPAANPAPVPEVTALDLSEVVDTCAADALALAERYVRLQREYATSQDEIRHLKDRLAESERELAEVRAQLGESRGQQVARPALEQLSKASAQIREILKQDSTG